MSYVLVVVALVVILAIVFGGKKLDAPLAYKPPPNPFAGAHDCGLRALANVMPDLKHDEIKDAFMQCADRWPNAGVTNVEFNVVLRFMKIFDRFQYNDDDGQTMSDFLKRKTGVYVLLIHGHFTVVVNGAVCDSPHYTDLDGRVGVYCSWRVLNPALR